MTGSTALHSDNFYERLGVDRSATTDDVKRAYRALLKQYPPEHAPEEFKRLREAYETLGNARSREEYDRRPDPMAERWLHTGLQALKAGEYDVAERYFKQVLIQQPGLGYVRNLLGLCFLHQDEPAKAAGQFERLLIEPDAPAAWFGNAGHAYHQLGRFLDAETAFREATRRATDNPVDYIVGLADVYLDQKMYSRAVQVLEDGINADGTVDFQDLAYFTKLLEVRIRELALDRVVTVLARMKSIATDEDQRRYLAWKLGLIGQQLIAAEGFRYAIPIARLTRELQPSDPDYFALESIGSLLQKNDFAGAEQLLAQHPSFSPTGWLAQLGKSIRQYMTEHRALAQMKPISSAPELRTINGIGTALYGARDYDKSTGSHVATLYFVVFFVPLFPIAAYRVKQQGPGRWSFLGKVPFGAREKRHMAVVAALFVIAVLWSNSDDRSSTYAAPVVTPAPVAAVELAQSSPATSVTPAPKVSTSRRTGVVYTGEVRNNGLPNSPASLRLAFDNDARRRNGELTIGPPLGGSGNFTAEVTPDSVRVTSISPEGDTIEWKGVRELPRDRIRGLYLILGGQFAGQGGTWQVLRVSGGGEPLETMAGDYGVSTAGLQAVGGARDLGCTVGATKEEPSSGVERTRPRRRGYGELRVENGSARDAVVLLNGSPSGQQSRAMFVRHGESATFTKVAPGRYTVQYESGLALNRRTWRFCTGASYARFDDTLTFDESRESGGVYYSRFELTLQPVVGGNVAAKATSAGEFVLPGGN